MVNKRLFSRVLALLFAIIFSACGYKENTQLNIVTPAENSRVSVDRNPNAGQPSSTTLSVYLETNRTDVISLPARLYVNETPQGTCVLNVNLESVCEIPMVNPGDQIVRLEVDRIDGQIVSDQVSYLWKPYEGLDLTALSLANVFNSNDPTTGYIFAGLFLLFVFVPVGLIAGRKNKIATSIVMVWAILIGSVMVLMAFNEALAFALIGKILGLIGWASLFGLIGFVASTGFSFRGSNKVDFVSRTWYPNGRLLNETTLRRKDGVFFGPGQYIPKPTAREIQAIADSLTIMIPSTMEQARYLIGQFPDPEEREEVLDLIAENGTDRYVLASAIQTIQNDPKAQVVVEKGQGFLSKLFGPKNQKSHLKG